MSGTAPLEAEPLHAPRVSPDVVISQVYGGGGNTSAPFRNDFIELFNRGSTPVTVTGWSVQYASAGGSTWSRTLITGTIAPGRFLLIPQSSGGANGVPLPAGDTFTGTMIMSAQSGKVALVMTSTVLSGTCPITNPLIIDFVGYGTSSQTCSETSPTPNLANQTAAMRIANGCVDTDNNQADFIVSGPNPRNSATTAINCASLPTPLASPVLIMAAFPEGNFGGDEAIQLMNVSGALVDIGSWQLGNGVYATTLPASITLAPGARVWIAARAGHFKTSFGFLPDYEYGSDSHAGVPNLDGTVLQWNDSGDEVIIRDGTGAIRDVLVYRSGNVYQEGWNGAAVPLFESSQYGAKQVFYRKLVESTGYPVGDSHTEGDWASSSAAGATLYGPVREGDLYGKKPMAPGWATGFISPTQALTANWVAAKFTEAANLSVIVGPDHIYGSYLAAINSATQSIYLQAYELHHKNLVDAIKARSQNGIDVKILMEVASCLIPEDQKFNLWAAHQLNATAQVYFMSNAAPRYDRYDCLHAKFAVIDAGTANQTLLVGSENQTCKGFPSDNKLNGTSGYRGYYFKTNAPQVIEKFLSVFGLDLDTNQNDIVPYNTPPYIWDGKSSPPDCNDETFYTIQKPAALDLSITFGFEVVQCPDICLCYSDSLIGMVRRAGAGDVVLVEQAYERAYWKTDPSTGPNPRLEAYIEAARRGARASASFSTRSTDAAAPLIMNKPSPMSTRSRVLGWTFRRGCGMFAAASADSPSQLDRGFTPNS